MKNDNTILAVPIETPEVVGAGGLVTGIDEAAADGTLLVRLDTATAHRLRPGAISWERELIPGVTLQTTDLKFNEGGANVYDAALSYSNSSVAYLMTLGRILVKKPGATFYTKTSMPAKSVNGNAFNRVTGKPLKVDPVNPAVCIAGFDDGAYITSNYGDNWTTISSLPAPIPHELSPGDIRPTRWIFAFDRSVTPVAGKSPRIYAFSPGNGVYISNDAGVTWSHMAGSPTNAAHMKVHPTTGRLILTGTVTAAVGPVNIWDGNSWTQGTRVHEGGLAQFLTIEFHPTTPNLVWGIEDGGGIAVSTTNGSSWGQITVIDQSADTIDIPWHISDRAYRTIGNMVFNPFDGYLYITAGVGVWVARTQRTIMEAYPVPTWPVYGHSRGIENMVASIVVTAPDGKRAVVMQDKQSMFFKPDEIGRQFTTSYGPQRGKIRQGSSCDYAPEDTNFWVTTYVPFSPESGLGYTEDFGKTWTHVNTLAAVTGGQGWGQVCVLSKDVWLVAPTVPNQWDTANAANRQQTAMRLTRDRGATWEEVVIGNGNTTFGQRLVPFAPDSRKVFAKDPTIPGRCIFYNCADVNNTNGADSVANKGTWLLDVPLVGTGPVAMTRTNPNRQFDGFSREWFDFKIEYAGKPGCFFMCGGNDALGAYYTTNYGGDWHLITGTDNLGIGTRFGETRAIGFGKRHPSSIHPTWWAYGYRIGEADWYDDSMDDFSRLGLWESRDLGETWTRIDQFPAGAIFLFNHLSPNPITYGEWTATLPGMGVVTRYLQHRITAV